MTDEQTAPWLNAQTAPGVDGQQVVQPPRANRDPGHQAPLDYQFQVDPEKIDGDMLIMIDESQDKPRAWYTILAKFLVEGPERTPVPFDEAFTRVKKLNLIQTAQAFQAVSGQIKELMAGLVPKGNSGP